MEQEQKETQLYLIMTEKEHQYGLYRIGEPKTTSCEDETTIRDLGKPLFEMDRSTFPKLMAFTAVDSSIFMVGGLEYDELKKIYRGSKNVFILDTKLSTLVPGPKLNSRKSNPHLITLGSKIFVLSDTICSDNRTSLDRKPRFEMLDTLDLKRGWSPLPLPQLYVPTTTMETVFTVDALAAVVGGSVSCSGGILLLSSSEAGTYAFDVDNQVWDHVSEEPLPFEETATSFPLDPSMCCAYSLKSRRFSAFRFCYGGNEGNSQFLVEEIHIDEIESLSPPLPPEICYRPRKIVAGPHSLIYFIDSGVDGELSYTLTGDRYVKVSALHLSAMKKRHMTHRVDEDETTKVDSNQRQWRLMSSCTTKDETLEVGLNKAESSKRGKKKREKGRVQEEKETNELTLTRIWRRSYFGGPICDPLLHVVAAFAM